MADKDGFEPESTEVVLDLEAGSTVKQRFDFIVDRSDWLAKSAHHSVTVLISYVPANSTLRSYHDFGAYNVTDALKMEDAIGAEGGRVPQPGDRLHFRFASKNDALMFSINFK